MNSAIDLGANWIDTTTMVLTGGLDPGLGSDLPTAAAIDLGSGASTVGSTLSSDISNAVSSVVPSKTTLLTGSVILIVILVLVLMILGKFEGIGLGL